MRIIFESKRQMLTSGADALAPATAAAAGGMASTISAAGGTAAITASTVGMTDADGWAILLLL